MPSTDALLVVPALPSDHGNGLAMRAGFLLEGLAQQHAVQVLVVPVFGPGPSTNVFIRRHAARVSVASAGVAVDPVAAISEQLATPEGRARRSTLHPLPGPSACITPAAAEAVADAAKGCATVWVMRLYLAPVLDELLSGGGPPVVLDLDELDAVRERRQGRQAEAEAYERLAAHYLPRIDGVAVASAAEAAEVATAWPGISPAVIPNAVRPPEEGIAPAPPHDLLFVGNLSYEPNIDGATWLCRSVLPALEDATVALVGSSPAADVRALGRLPGVTVAADVPAVGPWYAGSSVAVVPLRHGAGTRTKILEAWAHEVPVVTTSIGAEGIAVEGAALVADDEATFAAGCRDLLSDSEQRRALAEAGIEQLRRVDPAGQALAGIAHLAATTSRRPGCTSGVTPRG